MLQSDAKTQRVKVRIDNLESINVRVIESIEGELDPCDVVSMVFLLYNVPETALQRLLVYQRVSQHLSDKMNLLYEWALNALISKPMWRHEFLEALAICQLNNAIRKLGFDPLRVQKHYMPHQMHVSIHLNPMKKALYKLCENITSENLHTLKRSLSTYDIDSEEYNYCELILLDLMSRKFITIDAVDGLDRRYDVHKLLKVIRIIPELENITGELQKLQQYLNNEPTTSALPTSTPKKSNNSKETTDTETVEKYTVDDFKDAFAMIEDLSVDSTPKKLNIPIRKTRIGAYPIKNSERLGLCYIINQQEFYPSKKSIASNSTSEPLSKREGAIRDKLNLTKTMELFNFDVIIDQDIDHNEMKSRLKDIIRYRTDIEDSMFMLCVMSHGVKGHVYAADSVKVKIDEIQTIIDDGFIEHKLEIPKIMVIQACRFNDDDEDQTLSADGPGERILKKLNFLICYATAPELGAYRYEEKGSIFIQNLCFNVQKFAKFEHLADIFTKVTDEVADYCKKRGEHQIPLSENTLRKKLYLIEPE